MNNTQSHVVFNNNQIIISPDLNLVFNFLMKIEEEVNSSLNIEQDLADISKSYLELLKTIEQIAKTIKNFDQLNLKINFDPAKIADKLNFNNPLRSQMIILFASMEVIFMLQMSYEHKTSDEAKLRDLTKDTTNVKKFINSFILNTDNEYFLENKAGLSKITSSQLRDLRNSLTHFFSLSSGGLSLVQDKYEKDARKHENMFKQQKKGNIIFISKKDLRKLIEKASLLVIKKWSDDFINNNENFQIKIKSVNELVKSKGAIVLSSNNQSF